LHACCISSGKHLYVRMNRAQPRVKHTGCTVHTLLPLGNKIMKKQLIHRMLMELSCSINVIPFTYLPVITTMNIAYIQVPLGLGASGCFWTRPMIVVGYGEQRTIVNHKL
jgi:hypothetical protein